MVNTPRLNKCEKPGDPTGRSLGMLPGDTFVNNTEYHLLITDDDGEEIAMIDPGQVFEADREVTISFDANMQYTFRAYLNSGYRRN